MSHLMLKQKDLIVYHGCFKNVYLTANANAWLCVFFFFFEAVINSLLLSQPVLYRSNMENKLQSEGMLEVSVQ